MTYRARKVQDERGKGRKKEIKEDNKREMKEKTERQETLTQTSSRELTEADDSTVYTYILSVEFKVSFLTSSRQGYIEREVCGEMGKAKAVGRCRRQFMEGGVKTERGVKRQGKGTERGKKNIKRKREKEKG